MSGLRSPTKNLRDLVTYGGALAYLEAYPDEALRHRLTERVREVMPELSSPAGSHYEHNGCDWGYVLHTHRNNVRHAWNYARGSELGDLIVAMERPWVDWLAYNAVREPDGSFLPSTVPSKRGPAPPGSATGSFRWPRGRTWATRARSRSIYPCFFGTPMTCAE